MDSNTEQKIVSMDIIADICKYVNAALKKQNIHDAASYGLSLSFISTISKEKFPLFVGETIEGTLTQFYRDVADREIDSKELDEELQKMILIINDLIKALNKNEKDEIINSLIDLRYMATLFQINSPAKYKKQTFRRRL